MWVFIKCLLASVFVLSAFVAPALLIVGTVALFHSLMGDQWYVDLLVAPLVIIEFPGSIMFFLWAGPRVGDWAIESGK